MLRVIANDRMR